MARIYLEPGEHFEHMHSVESRSEVLQGRLVLERNGERLEMTQGDVAVTPPNVLEKFTNISDEESGMNCCIVHCSH